jgi:transcription elongation factor GreA
MKDVIFTPEGYKAIIAEKEGLETQRIDALKHLEAARELGDRSENGYYRAARWRLSSIDSQLRRIRAQIRNARIVEKTHDGTIGLGTRVLAEKDGVPVEYLIVGDTESDIDAGKISQRSPIGKALMGKKAGDRIVVHVPAGIMTFSIREVS